MAAMIGFVMEKGEDWRLLWWLPLQRFGYRQIMYYVVAKSVLKALTGPMVGWGKLERQPQRGAGLGQHAPAPWVLIEDCAAQSEGALQKQAAPRVVCGAASARSRPSYLTTGGRPPAGALQPPGRPS